MSELSSAVQDYLKAIHSLGGADRQVSPVDIAARLFLSAGTVRNYLTTIVTKLNARNRVDAIRLAEKAGWL